MDLPLRDPKKKINLEVSADQLNTLGNCLAIIFAISQNNTLRIIELTKVLFGHTTPKQVYELGQYLREVAGKEDPLNPELGPVKLILDLGGGKP